MRLREEGIDAQVVGHHTETFHLTALPRPYEVMIGDRADLERAKAVIADIGSPDPSELANEIEEGAWRPDLSGLDPLLHAVHCPACAAPLPLDASLEHCPSCGEGVDVVELIAHAYGPEAFEGLEQSETAHAGDRPTTIDWRERCRSCDASLLGQPLTGRCPGCGSLYAAESQP